MSDRRKESYFEPPGLYIPALVPSPLPPPRTRRPLAGTPTKPSTGRKRRRIRYSDSES